ncbi:MAG: hypothetical protein CM1200mP28_02780 [Deltaproteobacteria bacterium]|nr:MAG: hypothetical protein CM1200mP28_02780 [Deltaproteobacteria bacterium]
MIQSKVVTFWQISRSAKTKCHPAPYIINLMDRLGVTFNRTPEGNLDFRRFGGHSTTVQPFAGATTGQQLLYALDEQVRHFEVQGIVEKKGMARIPFGAVLNNDGRCVGAVIHNLRTGEIMALNGDAVILATGGPGLVYGRSTNSMV